MSGNSGVEASILSKNSFFMLTISLYFGKVYGCLIEEKENRIREAGYQLDVVLVRDDEGMACVTTKRICSLKMMTNLFILEDPPLPALL